MKTKKIIGLLVLLVVLFAYAVNMSTAGNDKPAASPATKYILYDDAVTTANDSLESAWYPIDKATTQLELYLYTDDTSRVDYYIDYTYSADTPVTLAVDSIVTTGTALTGKGKGVILRGYGASGIVNLIPGANSVRLRAYRHSSSETITAFHAAITEK